MKCDACGKEMTDESGQSFIGKSVEINYGEDAGLTTGDKFIGEINPMTIGRMTGYHFQMNLKTNSPSKEFIQKQLGEYKLNHCYDICWECWFKSLGVKP